jgi:hypothetical protein
MPLTLQHKAVFVAADCHSPTPLIPSLAKDVHDTDVYHARFDALMRSASPSAAQSQGASSSSGLLFVNKTKQTLYGGL